MARGFDGFRTLSPGFIADAGQRLHVFVASSSKLYHVVDLTSDETLVRPRRDGVEVVALELAATLPGSSVASTTWRSVSIRVSTSTLAGAQPGEFDAAEDANEG